MLVRKAFRYRVYPTAEQEARILGWEAALRFLWNLALEQRKMGLARPRDERIFPTAFDQINELTELRAELPWLADVPRITRVNRLHRKVRRQREHVLHSLSNAYAKSHGTVIVERLHIGNMVGASSTLARRILGSGWGRLVEMLRYKLAWQGGTLLELPAAYSSQSCSSCGHVDARSRSAQSFCCTRCGYADHADLNAAKILKSRANRSALPLEGTLPGSSRRRGKVVTLRVPRRSPQSPAL